MLDGSGWRPKVEIKAVLVQDEKLFTYKRSLRRAGTFCTRSVGKHAELRD